MKRNTLVFISILLFWAVIGCSQVSNNSNPKTITVTPILQLHNLNPPVMNINFGGFRAFGIDKNGIFYFLDSQKHRVLKFSSKGKFIGQIGSIGQNDSNLFFPTGIKIYGDTIYISDKGGKKIKLFALNGNFISGFDIENAYKMNWLDVTDNKIFTNVRYATRETYNKNKLISVFDQNGVKEKELGKILESQNLIGYLNFNSCFFRTEDGYITGAFKQYPVIFKCKTDGTQVYFKNISTLTPELKTKWAFIQESDKDRPDKMHSDNGQIVMVDVCDGFDVDANQHSFYAINTPISYGNVYHFDEKGNIVERLIIKSVEGDINIIFIYIDNKSNCRYGMGEIRSSKKKVIVFKF